MLSGSTSCGATLTAALSHRCCDLPQDGGASGGSAIHDPMAHQSPRWCHPWAQSTGHPPDVPGVETPLKRPQPSKAGPLPPQAPSEGCGG